MALSPRSPYSDIMSPPILCSECSTETRGGFAIQGLKTWAVNDAEPSDGLLDATNPTHQGQTDTKDIAEPEDWDASPSAAR